MKKVYIKISIIILFFLLTIFLILKNNFLNFIPKINFYNVSAEDIINTFKFSNSKGNNLEIEFNGTITPKILSVETPLNLDFVIDPSSDVSVSTSDGLNLSLNKVTNSTNALIKNKTNVPIIVSVISADDETYSTNWQTQPSETFNLVNKFEDVTVGKAIIALGDKNETFINQIDFESKTISKNTFLKGHSVHVMDVDANSNKNICVYGKVLSNPYWGGLNFDCNIKLLIDFK